MKKLICLFGALCLLLAGCADKTESAAPFVPADAAQALLDSGAFSENLLEIRQSVVLTLYGFDEADVTECAAYMPEGIGAEEIAVFVFADEQTAQDAQTALEARIEQQTFNCTGYLPAELPKLEAAIVEIRGNTALLVVANDATAAQEIVDGL